MTRSLTLLDRLLVDAQNALGTLAGRPLARRANPAADTPDVDLDPTERRHAAGLMRINHVGEVCAQGLYFGQAAVARDPQTRQHLMEAAQEETDHLQTLPEADLRSREIIKVMKDDEARHAEHAEQAGARLLPQPIPRLMTAASDLMKAVAYRF
ncbi:MAG: demethoxyubiquinone hydroxylase family protein [Lysobacteraceae bacterium]|nr:MAG: demethoxyubiquinone hydroxylase family protein [Xanthomonadaceae bacterium]